MRKKHDLVASIKVDVVREFLFSSLDIKSPTFDLLGSLIAML